MILRAFDRGYGQFLLLAGGAACIAVSYVSLPARAELRELESRRDSRVAEIRQLRAQENRLRRHTDAALRDPSYREDLLKIRLGIRGDNELTLDQLRRLARGGAQSPQNSRHQQ